MPGVRRYAFLPETLQKSKDRTQAEEQPSMTVIAKQILQSRNQQALIALACVWPLRFSCFSTVVAMHATQTLHAGEGKSVLVIL